MADLENRVKELEKKVNKLELDINMSLSEIKTSLVEIKSCVQNSDDHGELKNQLIEKDVKSNTTRIKKIEENQSKFVWAIILEVISIVFVIIRTRFKIGYFKYPIFLFTY